MIQGNSDDETTRTDRSGPGHLACYIRRFFITSGDLQALIDEGLQGITSNSTIFEKAIASSTDYEDLHRLVEEGKTVEEIYEALALDDIRRAADLLRPIYDGSMN